MVESKWAKAFEFEEKLGKSNQRQEDFKGIPICMPSIQCGWRARHLRGPVSQNKGNHANPQIAINASKCGLAASMEFTVMFGGFEPPLNLPPSSPPEVDSPSFESSSGEHKGFDPSAVIPLEPIPTDINWHSHSS